MNGFKMMKGYIFIYIYLNIIGNYLSIFLSLMKRLTSISILLSAGWISMAAPYKTAGQTAEGGSPKSIEQTQSRDTLSESESGLNLYDFVVNELDTVIAIHSGNVVFSGKRLNGFNYTLYFFEDYSVYELCISMPPELYSDIIIIQIVSWGNYKIRGDKILFYDRIAGFKMEASIEPAGIKFHKDYFPDLGKDVWRKPEEYGPADFLAVFDNKKAERYRKAYDKKYREPFEFTPDIYSSSLEISEDGRWAQKYGDLVLAEGTWRRKRNVLVLNCPKLGCNFYMTIGERRLTSMLLLMDIFGSYYYSPAESDKLFRKGFITLEKDDLRQ